jgi:hypothetical protein
MVSPGNPLRGRFDRPVAEVIEWIFTAGIAHHWAAGYGHVGADVRAWARIAGAGVKLPEMG